MPAGLAPADENFACAAREGGDIPPEIRAKMKSDRARAEAPDLNSEVHLGSQDDSEANIPFGARDRLREIAELAEAIAEEYFPNESVEPIAITDRKQITVSFGNYQDVFDGMLEHLSGRFHIYCNLDRVEIPGSDRARFTFAHELGHYYIDAHRIRLENGLSLPLSQCDYESKHPIEREADHFAAHLLMPTRLFVKLARGKNAGLPTILSLRKHFRTSVSSTACRYVTAGLAPCVAVKWSRDGLAWKVMSTEAREAELRGMIQSTASLPVGATTVRALSGESPPATGFFEAGTTAAMWFRSVTHGSFRNAILIEQAISLGRFGALTLLYPESGSFTQSA
jgi:Zn-dependent peptidase ImmA (M78 family)